MKDLDMSRELARVKKLSCFADVKQYIESYEPVTQAGNRALDGSHAIVRHSCGRYYVFNVAAHDVVRDSEGVRLEWADAHTARAAAVEYTVDKNRITQIAKRTGVA